MPKIDILNHNFDNLNIYNAYNDWLVSDQEETTAISIDSLNSALGGGFSEAGLHLITAESGFGKSQFASYLASQFASNMIKTVFFTAELQMSKLIPRILASVLKKDINSIINMKKELKQLSLIAEKTEEQLQQFKTLTEISQAYAEIIKIMPLRVFYTKSIEQIYKIAVACKQDGYNHVFIDHFSDLMSESDEFKSDYELQKYMVKDILSQMFSVDNLSIFLVCQFKKNNREDVKYGFRSQDDIFGPSELVKLSSNVIYLYETKKMAEQREQLRVSQRYSEPTRAVIKLLKAREGYENAKVVVNFIRSKACFYECENQDID